MNILITICARGGSKGLPEKNIKQLNGKPLISYSIEHAKQFSKYFKTGISLSTDDNKIKKVAAKYGLVTDYIRPAILATDNASKISAVKDLLLYEETKNRTKYDYVLDLDVSSPLRNLDDLLNSFNIFRKNKDAYNMFSVSPARRNPYFNMVEENIDGYYTLVKKIEPVIQTRQSAPKVYDMNASFYFYKRSFFDNEFKSVITYKTLIYEMPHICFDIDEPIDFYIIEYLLKSKKLNFNI